MYSETTLTGSPGSRKHHSETEISYQVETTNEINMLKWDPIIFNCFVYCQVSFDLFKSVEVYKF